MTRASLAILLSLLAPSAFAKDVYLSVGGSANSFFTDARIFNPNNKEITLQAYYLPRGNIDNSAEQPVEVKIGARQMKVYDNVVQSLFTRGDVGAIRLTSPDDFVATQRIYSLSTGNCGSAEASPCTLGQFVPGLDVATAMKRGVIIQLKVVPGKFRTNAGAVNPNSVDANVTWRLYDRNNNLLSSGPPVRMPPYGVIGPTGIDGTFFVGNPAGDLTDAWMSFSSDQPVFAYASVLDNATNDGTLVPASADSGTDPVLPPVVAIVASDFQFATGNPDLHAGDTVTFRLSASQGTHGIALFAPNGDLILAVDPLTTVPVDRTVTLPAQTGNYQFFCTHFCGEGHAAMSGTLVVSVK